MQQKHPPQQVSNHEYYNRLAMLGALGFVTLGALLTLVWPILAYLGIVIMAFGFVSTHLHLQRLHQSEAPLEPLKNFHSWVFLVASILLFPVLSYVQPFYQVILMSAGYGFLSWFFVDQYIFNAQQKMTDALKTAIENNDIDEINRLLAQGADCNLLDEHQECLWHAVAQADDDIQERLKALHDFERPARFFYAKDCLERLNSKPVRQQWRQLGHALNQCRKDFSLSNRTLCANAFYQLYCTYSLGLSSLILNLAQDLRLIIHSEDHRQTENDEHKTPEMLIAEREEALRPPAPILAQYHLSKEEQDAPDASTKASPAQTLRTSGNKL